MAGDENCSNGSWREIGLWMLLVSGSPAQELLGRTFGVRGDDVYLVDYENQQTLLLFQAGVSPGYPQRLDGAADSDRPDSFFAIQSPLTDWIPPDGTGDVIGESVLYRINPYTQGVTLIGGTGALPDESPIGVREIAYNPESGELWGVNWNQIADTNADGFYSINPLTGTATEIGRHGLNDVYGLAYDPATGHIVGTSHADAAETGDADFVRFDTATGQPTAGTPIPTGETRITDLWHDAFAGQMRGIGNVPNRLLDVDTETGQATVTAGGDWEGEGAISHNIVGLGGQAYTAPVGMSFDGIITTTAMAFAPDSEGGMVDGPNQAGFLEGSSASAWDESMFGFRETDIMAHVEAQFPWDSNWAQIRFSAEYYSVGEPMGDGDASGEFSFVIDSEAPGVIIPFGGAEMGAGAAVGIDSPMMLSVAASENLKEYWDEGAAWDNVDWTIELTDGVDTHTLSRSGDRAAAFEVTMEDVVSFTMDYSGDTTALTDLIEGDGEEWPVLRANLLLDVVLLDPSWVNPPPIEEGDPGTSEEVPLLPPDEPNPGDPWLFDPVTVSDGTGISSPLFFDPEIAIGYEYEVENGDPLMAGVSLPVLGDNMYDLYLVNEFGDLVELALGVDGGVEHALPDVSQFVVLGVDPELAIDPTDTSAFVTGLVFDSPGTVHLTMTPIVVPEKPGFFSPSGRSMKNPS